MNSNLNSSSLSNINISDEKAEIAIALLKEAGKQHEFRLMKLENKFDKLQENIASRFDKFEEANEVRRREMIVFQEKIAAEIKRTLDIAEANTNKIADVKKDTENKIEKAEKEINNLKEEVKTISSLKLKILGVIGFVGFMFAIFGRELFKLFTTN